MGVGEGGRAAGEPGSAAARGGGGVTGGKPGAVRGAPCCAAPLLGISKGTVRFGNTVALDRVDFSVMPGEIVGLLGSNGAGKSTLIKALIGFHRLDEGELLFEGDKVEFRSVEDARARGIETAFQDLSLADDLNASRNFFIGKEILRRIGLLQWPDLRRMQHITLECLRELGFPADLRRDDPVGSLSGGERQLIAIARAAWFATRLLILDEPFSALSESATQNVLALIKKAKARGVSVIVVTHHAPEVFEVGDRFVVLQAGRNIAELRKGNTDMLDLEKLLISQRLAAVKEMAAGVAHQIKNPLGILRVSVDVLKRKLRAARLQQDYEQVLDVLSSEIESLDHIVTGFMDFAHQTRVQKSRCSVGELLRKSVDSIPRQARRGVRIRLELSEPSAEYLLDPYLMKQALANMIVNAAEASSGGGVVEVRASTRSGRLAIEVQDWGCGMDDETVKRIYDPFFSSKSTGTGLGLSIAHRVIELHEGRIEVETGVGKGTTFRLTI
jgi:signal transduction histidine kinase